MPERTPLNLNVSTESHDGWVWFCATYGTTMTAFAEAIGLTLGQLDEPENKLPPLLRATLAESRRIAAQRLGRRH